VDHAGSAAPGRGSWQHRAFLHLYEDIMDNQRLELTVDSMSCGHCVKAITQALKELDPAAQVQVDLPSKRVAVQTSQPREAVVAALDEAGYATA
jgi:copper chaperone